jgi:ribosomal protein S21
MAEADLDAVIRHTAKQQNKTLMTAARKRHALYMARSAKAKDKEAKARYRLIAKNTMLHATATARRLQNSAANAADSYARAMKKAAEEMPAKKPDKKAT